MSELNFSIPYDKERDRNQTTAATAFLLNIPHHVIFERLMSFMARADFTFDLDDRDARDKGCWAVQVRTTNDFQLKICHEGANYSYTLGRLAVRLWHGEDSVLRLLLSKNHEAVRVCYNVHCFNPEHIVVESKSESSDRKLCKEEGRCSGHSIWTKYRQEKSRASCICS